MAKNRKGPERDRRATNLAGRTADVEVGGCCCQNSRSAERLEMPFLKSPLLNVILKKKSFVLLLKILFRSNDGLRGDASFLIIKAKPQLVC